MPLRERHGPTRAQSWAVLALGLIAVAGSTWLALSSDTLVRPTVQALLSAWITCTFVASGVIAWRRRPASRFGPLLLLAGALWVLTTLQWSNHSAVFSLGHLFDMVVPAVFLHVFLAYPTGRLEGRTERTLVFACYVAGGGLQVLKIELGVTPGDLLVLASHPEAAQWVERAQLVAVSTLLLAGTVRLLVRRRGPTRVAHGRDRRVRSLLVDAFGLALAMLAVLLLLALFGGPPVEAFRHFTFFALGSPPSCSWPVCSTRGSPGPTSGVPGRAAGGPDAGPAGVRWPGCCTTRPSGSSTGCPSTPPGPTRTATP